MKACYNILALWNIAQKVWWETGMAEMLTAKEMQNLLHVNRSTIYRMAEAGRLPAVKVGKQWRFPVEEVDEWLKSQRSVAPVLASGTSYPAASPALSAQNNELASLLPMSCVQLIQDTFANTLILRLIFARYLIDRNVGIDEKFIAGDTTEKRKQSFNELIGSRKRLNAFFRYLEDRFNGNLFETKNAKQVTLFEAFIRQHEL